MSANIEAARWAAALEAVRMHFPLHPGLIGIGSGTTMGFVVEAIKGLGRDLSRVGFVPTGCQSRQLIIQAGLRVVEFEALPEAAVIDVAFHGAEEVDEDLNCIQSDGACLYQEKLVAMQADRFICVADHRKMQARLVTKVLTIPVEVEPKAARQVVSRLRELGSRSASGGGPSIREDPTLMTGPFRTDQGFFIIDAPFSQPLLISADLEEGVVPDPARGLWEVETLAQRIKQLNGVLAVGIFCGPTGLNARGAMLLGGQRPTVCYFGMADGSVAPRYASAKRSYVF